MSQKVSIISVKHSGSAIYIGNVSGTDLYTTNPDKIMNWLCDGYRTRFNQHRSKRKKYDENNNLVPIGNNVIDITDKEARRNYSYLSAIPAMILQAPEKKENTEWFTAVKSRKKSINRKYILPRFKSRKKEDQVFTCWFNNGANANYSQTGKKTGVITITGKNPPGKRQYNGDKASWKINIRIRITQKIRPYTSVLVNWSKKTVIFTNQPEPLNSIVNEDIIGIDRGGVIAISTSDNEKLHPDKNIIQKYENKKKFYQRKMGKARHRAKKSGGDAAVKSVMKGNTYQHNKQKAAHYSKKLADYKKSWIQETTTYIIKKYGTVVLEDLSVKNMTHKGGNRKKNMNKSFLSVSPAAIATCLEYKSLLNGNKIVYINPSYTSQCCSQCHYTSKINRESQSIFSCKHCGYINNADVNAAKNIKNIYKHIIKGTDLSADKHYCVYQNGNGEIIRPVLSLDKREDYFVFSQGNLVDIIDPVKVVSEPIESSL